MDERIDSPAVKILVIDDDAALLGVMEIGLKIGEDYTVAGTTDGREALEWIEKESFDIVVTDYSLGENSPNGLEILKRALDHDASILGIIVTAYASLEISLKAIRLGAYDFLTKPFQLDELQLAVRNAADRVRLTHENQHLRGQVAELAESLRGIKEDHRDLMNQLHAMKDRSSYQVAVAGMSPRARSDSNLQVQAYLRIGETIGEQLERENRRLETLFKQGLIPEPAYRKGLEERSGAKAS